MSAALSIHAETLTELLHVRAGELESATFVRDAPSAEPLLDMAEGERCYF